MSEIDVIEHHGPGPLSPELAEQIRLNWKAETGRDCIVLGYGLRYAGSVTRRGPRRPRRTEQA